MLTIHVKFPKISFRNLSTLFSSQRRRYDNFPSVLQELQYSMIQNVMNLSTILEINWSINCSPPSVGSNNFLKQEYYQHVPAFSSGSKRKLSNTFILGTNFDSPRNKFKRILHFREKLQTHPEQKG